MPPPPPPSPFWVIMDIRIEREYTRINIYLMTFTAALHVNDNNLKSSHQNTFLCRLVNTVILVDKCDY